MKVSRSAFWSLRLVTYAVMALMCAVGVWSWHFAWVAPVVFLGYVWTAPIPARRPVGENAPPTGVIPSGCQVS